MNSIGICIDNGGLYNDIYKINGKEINSFKSEESIMDYIFQHNTIKLEPVNNCICAILVTKHITSVNFKK